jgi:hypothetical protein
MKAIQQQSQPNLTFNNAGTKNGGPLGDAAIGRLIVNMNVYDLQSFQMIENEGFKSLIKNGFPNYVMKCRKYYTNMVEKLHAENILALKKSSNKHVTFTTDIWTSTATTSFITFTSHFISDDFQCKPFLLDTKEFPGNHTGENIKIIIQAIPTKWDIYDKQSFILNKWLTLTVVQSKSI